MCSFVWQTVVVDNVLKRVDLTLPGPAVTIPGQVRARLRAVSIRSLVLILFASVVRWISR